MASLKAVVIWAVRNYAVKGLNGCSVLTPDERFLTGVCVVSIKAQRLMMTSLSVHFEGNSVIVEHDINRMPLVDALTQAKLYPSQHKCA
jgi:hypothetical protein